METYASGESKEGFIELPREIVRGYMFFLANQVAGRRGLARCTDDQYSFSVAAFFSEDANFEYIYDVGAESFYASLVVQDLLPQHIGSIPMHKVLKAVEQSKDERAAFRSELIEFSERLLECESTEHARVIANDYTKGLIDAKSALRASQGFMNKDDIGSLFTVGVPVAATAFGAAAVNNPNPFHFWTIAPSLLVGAVAAYMDYRRVTSVKSNPSGAGYLLSLDRAFAGTGRLPSLSQHIEEFVND